MTNLRRFLKLIPIVMISVFILAGSGLIRGLATPEKSFSLPRVTVEAELARDGSMHVVEHITYDFHGPFSYGTRPIPVGAYEIADARVSENGRELSSVGAPYNLQWFFSAKDEQRTFDVEYTVRPGATVAPDVGEVYWKWVGEQHPKIGEVTATLTVPPGSGEVQAWGHGDLTGKVTVEGDTVRWVAPNVPEGSFVEGRVTVPSSRFTVPPTGEPRLDPIVAQETAWAEAANAQREAAARDATKAAHRRDLANVVVPFVILLGMAVFAWLFFRYGREPKVPDVGEYVRDLPDDPPAVLDALRNWGSVSPLAFGATVVDLAQRGHLAITEEKIERSFWPDSTDYRFHRTDPAPADPLTDFDERVMKRLFADGPETTQSELTTWAAAHTSSAQTWWQGFRTSVRTAYDAKKYQHGERGMVFAANLGAALVVAGAGGLAFAVRAWWVGAIAVVWALLQAGLTVVLRQRTSAGALRAAQWDGVEHFLRDFSELEDAPPGHLVLWERYLVYAVALGVSARLVQAMALRVPEIADTTNAGRWYVPSPGGGGHGIGGLGSFGSGFGASFTAAATPRSSGSGGGGGFSGGGGGGGCGGCGGIGAG